MSIKISRVTPPGKKPERRFRAIDAARAIGCTRDRMGDVIRQKYGSSISNGIRLEDIADYLVNGGRKQHEDSVPNVNAVALIRKLLYLEYGILIEEEPIPDWFRELQEE